MDGSFNKEIKVKFYILPECYHCDTKLRIFSLKPKNNFKIQFITKKLFLNSKPKTVKVYRLLIR